MDLFFQQLLNGVITGSTYALIALGLTLIYGVMRVPDFSLGALFALGAFIAFYWVSWFGPSFYLGSLFLVVIISAAIGLLKYKLVFKPLRSASHGTGFVAAMGLYFIMEGALNVLFGTEWRTIESPYTDIAIKLGEVSTTLQHVMLFLICVVTASAVYIFIMKSKTGKKLRATSEDAVSASLLGISLDKMSSLTFAIGSALAGIAGVMVAPTFMVGASIGIYPITKAFIVVVLGGMGSIQGAIAGGFILGIVETFGASYISSMYKHVFSFALFLIILIIKPSGLFKS